MIRSIKDKKHLIMYDTLTSEKNNILQKFKLSTDDQESWSHYLAKQSNLKLLFRNIFPDLIRFENIKCNSKKQPWCNLRHVINMHGNRQRKYFLNLSCNWHSHLIHRAHSDIKHNLTYCEGILLSSERRIKYSDLSCRPQVQCYGFIGPNTRDPD